jgi:hypothetical protein
MILLGFLMGDSGLEWVYGIIFMGALGVLWLWVRCDKNNGNKILNIKP